MRSSPRRARRSVPRSRPASSRWHPGSGFSRSTVPHRDRRLFCWEENLFRTTRNPARSISRCKLLSASMFGLGVIGIDLLTRGGNIWIGMAALALGAGSGLGLVLHSRSQSEPIVPFDLLRNPVFSLSVATSIASSHLRCWRLSRCPSFSRAAPPQPGGNRAIDDAVAAGGGDRGRPSPGASQTRVSAAVLGAAGLVALARVWPFGLSSREPDCGRDCMAHALCGLGFGFFPGTEQPIDALGRRQSRGAGRQAACSPPRVSRGRPSPDLAAISFRIAGHSETTALGMAAALAAIAAVASGARLYHPGGARPVKPALVADAP